MQGSLSTVPACLILLPLFWSAIAFALGPGRGALLALAALSVQCLLAIALAANIEVIPTVYPVGGWGAPLGIDLHVDGLAALMLLLTQTVALALGVYARAYFSDHPAGGAWFWPLFGGMLAGMNALFLSGDVFNLYVALELVGLTAVGLVAAAGGAGPVRAAMRYLLVTLIGSGAWLLGVALLYGSYGTVSLTLLSPLLAEHAAPAVALAAVLMLFGLMLKTALFPFHFWLPTAHGGATTPVSALLSALVVKATFYLFVRLWLGLFAPIAHEFAAQLLGVLGTAAIVWGSLQAWRQVRLKMLVAYSTVAQVGYLFLLFPLATGAPPGASSGALQGVLMQVLAHGLAKAAMFCATGAMIVSMERDDIRHLGGVSNRLPLPLFAFGLAGVTLMGLPPSSGFIAKWLLIDAAIDTGQWVWIAVLIAGGLLTALYVFKVLRHAFQQVERDTHFLPLPRALTWIPLLLALASHALGLRATEILMLVEAR